MKLPCAGGCGKMDEPNKIGGYLWVTDCDHGERRYLCWDCAEPLGYPNGLCHMITPEEYAAITSKTLNAPLVFFDKETGKEI